MLINNKHNIIIYIYVKYILSHLFFSVRLYICLGEIRQVNQEVVLVKYLLYML